MGYFTGREMSKKRAIWLLFISIFFLQPYFFPFAIEIYFFVEALGVVGAFSFYYQAISFSLVKTMSPINKIMKRVCYDLSCFSRKP